MTTLPGLFASGSSSFHSSPAAAYASSKSPIAALCSQFSLLYSLPSIIVPAFFTSSFVFEE